MTKLGNVSSLGNLTDRHLGRRVTVCTDPPLPGQLIGVVPVGDRVRLVLVVGGARVFTDELPEDMLVEIHAKESATGPTPEPTRAPGSTRWSKAVKP